MAGSTSITHIIGTTSVILLFFVVGSYYNGYFTELNVEAYKAQLGQVAEYYAANMNDLVVLGSLTENSVFLSKEVVTPSSIGERIYNISLTKMTSSDGDKQVFSVVVSIDSLNIFAIADMVWSPNLNIQLYTNQAITGNGTVTLQIYSEQRTCHSTRTNGSPGFRRGLVFKGRCLNDSRSRHKGGHVGGSRLECRHRVHFLGNHHLPDPGLCCSVRDNHEL